MHQWIPYFVRGKTIQWGKDSLFNKWCWEKWTATCKKMKSEHFLIACTKINSKWFKDLNVRPETIKLLEENIGRALYDINQSKILYDPPPRVLEIKTNVYKWIQLNLKALPSKGNYKQGEKTTLRMGVNNSKWNNWQRINFQNTQAAYTTQHQKKQTIQSKSGKKT